MGLLRVVELVVGKVGRFVCERYPASFFHVANHFERCSRRYCFITLLNLSMDTEIMKTIPPPKMRHAMILSCKDVDE